jgi:hypothetical protein
MSVTNLTIACFAEPSFQDARGCAMAAPASGQSRDPATNASEHIGRPNRRPRMVGVAFIASSFLSLIRIVFRLTFAALTHGFGTNQSVPQRYFVFDLSFS